jgi:phage host-nuclease inhibitor protein Gam
LSARKGISSLDVQQEAVSHATDCLSKYADVSRQISEIEIDLNDAISKLQEEAEAKLKPLRSQREDFKTALQIFAQSYRKKLAVGKTISLPTGTLSWKTSKPSLDIKDDKAALKSLRKLKRQGRIGKLSDFVKTSFSIKKDPLKKYPDLARQVEGLIFREAEELFYIDPVKVEADTAATGKVG